MHIVDGILEVILTILILGVVFTIIERFFRGVKAPNWYKRPDAKTDVAFYFFNSLVAKTFQSLAIIAVVIAITMFGGVTLVELRDLFNRLLADDVSSVSSETARNFVGSLPLVIQVLIGLLIADFLYYWGHRIFHKKPFWHLHAIHHSPPMLDWLSSVRFHPIEDAVMAVFQVVPLLFIGFDPEVFLIVTPIIGVWDIFSHANVTWDLGPLKYVFITPRFHRWHHTSEAEGLDKNFAGLFPIYDLLFRTWYMPHRIPTEFGAGEEPVPAGFWYQLLYPFRKPKATELLARDIISESKEVSKE